MCCGRPHLTGSTDLTLQIMVSKYNLTLSFIEALVINIKGSPKAGCHYGCPKKIQDYLIAIFMPSKLHFYSLGIRKFSILVFYKYVHYLSFF